MRELSRLLERLFEAHGFQCSADVDLEGRSGTVFQAPLLCEGPCTAMVQCAGDGVVDAALVSDLATVCEDMGADILVLAHLGPREPGAAAAGSGRVVLWGRDQLVRVLGEWQLAAALDVAPDPLPLQPEEPAAAMAVAIADDAEPQASVGADADAFPMGDVLPPAFQDVGDPFAALAALASQEAADAAAPEPAPAPVASAPRRLRHDDRDDVPVWGEPADARDPAPAASSPPASAALGLAPAAQFPSFAATAPPLGRPPLATPLPAPAQAWAPPVGTWVPAQPSAPAGPPMRMPEGAPAWNPAPEAFPLELPGLAPTAATTLDVPDLPRAGAPANAARRMLPVRIPQDEAARRVKDRLFGIDRAELVLVPVHLYDYECDLLVGGSLKTDTVDGRIQVNAADRVAKAVDPDTVNPDAPSLLAGTLGLQVHQRVLRVADERARELATAEVLKAHTRRMDVRVPDTDGQFFYTEKRKVAPQRDHVRLTPLGAFDRPVWRLFGVNGHLDLDAVDGSVVDQQLSRGDADVLVLE